MLFLREEIQTWLHLELHSLQFGVLFCFCERTVSVLQLCHAYVSVGDSDTHETIPLLPDLGSTDVDML